MSNNLFAVLGRVSAKQAALDPSIANAVGGGLAGAGLAGGLGALSGALSPGETEEEGVDEFGRPVVKKVKKNRLLSALTGGLGGAAIGGLGGAAIGGLGTEAIRKYGPPSVSSAQRSKAVTDMVSQVNSKEPLIDRLGKGWEAAKSFGSGMKDSIGYPLLNREDQFKEISKHAPAVTKNPISDLGNSAYDFLGKQFPSLMPGAK